MTTALTFDKIKALVFASVIFASAFLSLILAKPAHAATIALNSVSTKANFGFTCTFAHTVSGTDKLLIVGITNGGSSMSQVLSVKYGSQSLTKKGTAVSTRGNSRADIWYLVNPASGTQNVSATFNTSGMYHVCGASSWTGVNQTTPLGAFASTGGTGTSSTLNVASAAGEVVTDVLGTYLSVASVTPSQTQVWNVTLAGFNTNGSSYQAGAASTTMSWSINPSPNLTTQFAHAAVPIKPAP